MVLTFSAFLFFISLFFGFFLVRGLRQIDRLEDTPVLSGENLSTVAIVIAVRNEEKHVEAALQSILEIDYPSYSISVVNDRSTDRTAEILTTMQKKFSRIQLTTVKELPAGWIGKNHALYVGARETRSEWILFTDADVHFDPQSLRRALRYVQDHGTDHLTLFPRLEASSFGAKLFALTFTVLFFSFTRPWRIRNRRSRDHLGIGAFNLIRRKVYEQIGTHEAIRLRPDDDLRLGKLVKDHGFQQEVVWGSPAVWLDFYPTIWEAVLGFEKNSFSGVNYRLSAVLAASVALLSIYFWPFVALAVCNFTVQIFSILNIFVLCATFGWIAPLVEIPSWMAVTYPIGVALFLFTFWRATWKTLRRGGIIWRETFYSLKELKSAQVQKNR